MKNFLFIVAACFTTGLYGQYKQPGDYGFKHIQTIYQTDTVDILIKSKKGDEQKKTNFTFKAYVGTDHNFFPVKANGETDFDIFNWDKVANDWRNWLKKQ